MVPLAKESATSDNSSRLRHDIRNQINQILGYSEMLIDEASETAGQPFVSDLRRIRDAGHGLLALVESAGFSDASRETADSAAGPFLEDDSYLEPDVFESAAKTLLQSPLTDGEKLGNLLIVDDNAENRALLVRRLEARGHVCTAVDGGMAALELMRAGRYDIVLLDLMMPDMDGFAVLSQVKSNPAFRNTPVIMISASDELDSVVRCIEMGAADYLTKPFNTILLGARVDACLREKRFRDREEMLVRELEEKYRRERRIADALQRSLIEEIPENLFPNLTLATIYEAAWAEAQVGGDLFDAFLLPNGRVALVVADASGKGLAAAARIAQAKYVLRAFAREYEGEPDQIVSHLNDYLCDANPMEDSYTLSFVALSLAIVDPATGECKFVGAGSEAPLIVRAKDGRTDTIESHGLPLGIESGSIYPALTATLEPGDVLVMCTDGITEARRGTDLLGYDRMTQLAVDAACGGTRGVREIGTAIMEGARDFGRGTLKDDACLLIARRNTP